MLENYNTYILAGKVGHVDGDIETCRLDFPYSVLVAKGAIFIGGMADSGPIRKVEFIDTGTCRYTYILLSLCNAVMHCSYI